MVTPLRVTCSRPPLNSDPLLIVTVRPSAMRSVADSLPSMPWTETTARRLDGAGAAETGVGELWEPQAEVSGWAIPTPAWRAG